MLGRIEEALRCFDTILDLDPSYAIRAWHEKGVNLGKLGRYEEALQSWDRIIEKDPKYVMAWYSKGIILSYLGRNEEALTVLTRASTSIHGARISGIRRG